MGFIVYIRKTIMALGKKSGAEMVEGAISLPLIIITAMLLIRMFTFYLEILNTSVAEHAEALDRWDAYSGPGLQTYRNTREVKLMRGGVLMFNAMKKIDTKAYLLNEDLWVRAGELVK